MKKKRGDLRAGKSGMYFMDKGGSIFTLKLCKGFI